MAFLANSIGKVTIVHKFAIYLLNITNTCIFAD